MANITFKAKVETIYNMDDTVNHKRIKIPKLSRSHCDMNAFRRHPKFGGLANSDLFPNVLARVSRDLSKTGYLVIDNLPDNVTVEQGYLATVTINV